MSEPTKHKKGGQHLASKGSRPKRPDSRTKNQKIRDRFFIAITAVAAVIVTAYAGINLFFSKPVVPERPTPPPVSSGAPGENPVAPGINGSGRREDFFTFLVIGRDTGGGGNTDTMILAAYDVKNQKLNVMSIPRDTMINVSWDIKRINSVYPLYDGGDKGIKALDDEISQLVGFRPDFQVVADWKAVGELVDALGGVYFDVPRNMDYDDPTQDLHIHQKKGYRKLNGDDAMQVIRYRHDNRVNGVMLGYPDGDLGRIKTQQGFLKAVVEQCLKIENATRIDKLLEVFKNNVTTNLSLRDLGYFAKSAVFGGLNMDSVNFVTMPCEGKLVWSRYVGDMQSYVVPKTDELVALVNECFNPYLEPLDSKDLDIMFVNKDGTIGSSTGILEDKKANPAWLAEKNKPAPTPTPTPTPSDEAPPSGEVPPSDAPQVTPTPPPAVTAPPPAVTPSHTPVETAPPATLPPMPTVALPPASDNPGGPPQGIPIL